jgi:hypothetical protein
MSALLITISIWLTFNLAFFAAFYFKPFHSGGRARRIQLEPRTHLLPGAPAFARRPRFKRG